MTEPRIDHSNVEQSKLPESWDDTSKTYKLEYIKQLLERAHDRRKDLYDLLIDLVYLENPRTGKVDREYQISEALKSLDDFFHDERRGQLWQT